MAKIFISYRRDDSQHAVDRIYDALRKQLPRRDIFMDVDNIPKGVDFVEYLGAKVAQCEVLLAIIGPQWLTIEDQEGNRRLDNEDDFVRIEIAEALKRNIPVVPVLLDGAPMPKQGQLPDVMHGFERRNGAEIRRNTLPHDVDELVSDLGYGRRKGRSVGAIMIPLISLIALGGTGIGGFLIDPFNWFDREATGPSVPADGTADILEMHGLKLLTENLVSSDSSTRRNARKEIAAKLDAQDDAALSQAFIDSIPIDHADKYLLHIGLADVLSRMAAPLNLKDRQAVLDKLNLMRRTARKDTALQDAIDSAEQKLVGEDGPDQSVEEQETSVGATPTPTSQLTLADPYPVVGASFTDCSGCPEMVVVPSGSFTMGAPLAEPESGYNEGPQRVVQIGYKFAVGKYEVTWAQWEACVSAGGCDDTGRNRSGEEGGWGKGSRPVVNVSWHDAKVYADWLSRKTGHTYRLLSEAEWEYAARAGTTTPFSFGETISPEQANYDGNYSYNGGPKGAYHEQTVTVGSYPANAFGLYDMHGNVWEWVEDCYKPDYSNASSNGSPFTYCSPSSLRVIRGGSWNAPPLILRSALRGYYTPSNWDASMGFRLARDLPD